MNSLYRWLNLLASTLGAELHTLEKKDVPCTRMMGNKSPDVMIVPTDACNSCNTGRSRRCKGFFPVLVRLPDRLCVFAFARDITPEQRGVLTDLLALSARLVKTYARRDDGRRRMELLERVLFFLASRFFHGLWLKTGDGFSPIVAGDLPLSFYEELELKRQKLGLDEGNLESEKQTFWFKIFPGDEGESGIIYWQPKEAPSLQPGRGKAAPPTVPMIGRNPAFLEALHLIKKTASSENTILLYGESGTGKELFARAIHLLSPRRERPFVAINCAAIPENLLESELFGYEEGSFTGARKGGKPGKFELAQGGTLFLDEIGDMPLALQAKLLRVLQDKKLERVGGTQPLPVDVRFVAATHRNLEELVQRNMFRQDLFFRLNVIPIRLPALRDRKEDIEPLLNYFLKKHTILQNKPFKVFAADVVDFFKTYSWPGNIRELENVVAYSVSVCSEDIVELKDLQPYIRDGLDTRAESGRPYRPSGRRTDPGREELRELLDRFGRSTAAKKALAGHLGISPATLYRWLRRYHIE